MRRALIAGGVTVLGVAYVLNFKVTPHLAAIAQAPTSTQADGGATSATPGAFPPPAATPTPAPARVPDGTFTGPSVFVRFGYVQVRIVVSGGRVTDVQPVDLPGDRARSAEISRFSGPILRQEAIQAQSAHINVVSGATYTSTGFAQSLEGALQQAQLG